MTLLEIRSAVAAYLKREPSELTVDGVDLGLAALNHARQRAELLHDFEFSRKLATVSVHGVTGGSLEAVVEYGTTTPTLAVKTLVDVGVFDDDGNLQPVEWTTVADSMRRAREDNSFGVPRYPTDGQAIATFHGRARIVFSANSIYVVPKVADQTYALGLEAYFFTPDWTDADLASNDSVAGHPWNTRGSEYLMWQGIVELNNLYKEFVFRQEGNLPPPEKNAEAALAVLREWDIYSYEQFRRHRR